MSDSRYQISDKDKLGIFRYKRGRWTVDTGYWIAFYVLIFMFVLFGCKQSREDILETPDYHGEQRIEKFSMVETVAGKKQWELEAAQAHIYDTEKRTKLEKLKVRFYKEEKPSSLLMAEEGEINAETGDMQAYGNVVFVSEEEQTKVETDRLFWDSHKKKITTDAFVKKTGPRDIVTGYGLEAEPDLSQVLIKREVKAQVIIDEKKNNPSSQP